MLKTFAVEIPLPDAVFKLHSLFDEAGFVLYGAGGAFRDYLFEHHHGNLANFAPKDVDLTTDALPDQVLEILSSPKAKDLGIRAFAKGAAFGVISAIFDNKEYEIATFREEWYDPSSGDGRRPDKVWFSTPELDASRRDLTINALFYDLKIKKIIDFTGFGLKDIESLKIRPVGNVYQRFAEDKLRVLRVVRFFSKYHSKSILTLEKDTLEAIKAFSDLRGVSPERIAAEFQTGLEKSLSPVRYVLNYKELRLFGTIFPGLVPSFIDLEKIGNSRNIKVVLAWIFRNLDPKLVRETLNSFAYKNEITDGVSFLVRLHRFDVRQVDKLLKRRDLDASKEEILAFSKLSDQNSLEYFANYKIKAKSEDFLHLKGEEIGKAMTAFEVKSYLEGLKLEIYT
jgi:tRNA nucleotidyltransferase/poly(A) polymerase